MSHEENEFICTRTLKREWNKPEYTGCKECCLFCPDKTTCPKACVLVQSNLEMCPEAISKKGFVMGEIFEKKG